jgi:ribosomal protein L11 methylase PrmA
VVDPGSFRDPSGRVFRRDGFVYRQVDGRFADEWAAFRGSGLYDRLVAERLLIAHEAVSLDLRLNDGAIAVIRPEPVPFISYPYEWSFSQLQDAALATLRIQSLALDAGMTLKDASAFNIQFLGGRPVLIDSLSFERREADAPWVAYRQFCEHFLAPLALMARRDIRLASLLRSDLEGIPLDLAARLLPRRTRLDPGLAAHIHLHARSQRRHADDAAQAAGPGSAPATARVSITGQRALLDSLGRTVRSLSWRAGGTEWADYTEHTNYGQAASDGKDRLVREYLETAGGATVIDLGANTGRFSAIAAGLGRTVIAPDIDPAAVERHYRSIRSSGEAAILPLLLDLMNPSPASGWALAERASIFDRLRADVLMALALIHHLAIARNVPLSMVASVFATMAPVAIVEWVPKEDSQVQRLLATRQDIFSTYTMDGFREAFGATYEIVGESPIEGTVRHLFLLRRRA